MDKARAIEENGAEFLPDLLRGPDEQLGRLSEAVADTQTYLNLSPDAPDADAVREQLKKIQARRAMLN